MPSRMIQDGANVNRLNAKPRPGVNPIKIVLKRPHKIVLNELKL